VAKAAKNESRRLDWAARDSCWKSADLDLLRECP
jgi:hypothetical protein